MITKESSKVEKSQLLPGGAYELNWREVNFKKRIGSGSFGDCYQGERGGQSVAIKKMRSGW